MRLIKNHCPIPCSVCKETIPDGVAAVRADTPKVEDWPAWVCVKCVRYLKQRLDAETEAPENGNRKTH